MNIRSLGAFLCPPMPNARVGHAAVEFARELCTEPGGVRGLDRVNWGVMFLTGMMLKDGWDDGYGWFTMAFWTVMMVFWMVYDGSYPLGCPNIGFLDGCWDDG